MSAEFVVLRNHLKILSETLSELVIGSGANATITIDDPIAAREHVRLRYAAGEVWLDPLDTSTGTYVNGLPVTSATRLKAGDTVIIGASRVAVALDTSQQPARVQIEVSEKDESLFDRKEPDRWVHDEVSFGRFDATRWTVWLSTAAALLIVLVVAFWPAARLNLIAPGPLSAAHAGAGLTCSSCHHSSGGATHNACLSCHEDKNVQHPGKPSDWTPHGFFGDAVLAENGCVSCHREHGHEEFVPTTEQANRQCQHCHDNSRALNLGDVKTDRTITFTSFDHQKHIAQGQPCATCHKKDNTTGRDFGVVDYEVCQGCHGPEGIRRQELAAHWPGDGFIFSPRWHGTDGNNCARCHTKAYAKELRTVTRPGLDGKPTEASFTLARRKHDFVKHASLRDADGRSCQSCHRKNERTLLAETEFTGPFRHALHVRELGGDASCRTCHEDVFLAEGLATEDYPGPPLTTCEGCHAQNIKRRNAPVASSDRITRIDFPHAYHTTEAARRHPDLEDGCISCHVFDKTNVHDLGAPTLREGVADCTGCHSNHENISGNACQHCHKPGDAVFANRRTVRRAVVDYPHHSKNHAAFTQENCDACHGNVVQATSIDFDLPVPSEKTCMTSGCHTISPTSGQFHFPLSR